MEYNHTAVGVKSTLAGNDASFVRLREGRLIELRICRLASVVQVESLQADIVAAVNQAGADAIVCADYRASMPMLPEVASAWSRAMRHNNARIVRGGLLLDPANEMFNLQMERVVRCAANPNRRMFTSFEELRDWVSAACQETERRALAEIFRASGSRGELGNLACDAQLPRGALAALRAAGGADAES
jgi:hypothetical protein